MSACFLFNKWSTYFYFSYLFLKKITVINEIKFYSIFKQNIYLLFVCNFKITELCIQIWSSNLESCPFDYLYLSIKPHFTTFFRRNYKKSYLTIVHTNQIFQVKITYSELSENLFTFNKVLRILTDLFCFLVMFWTS